MNKEGDVLLAGNQSRILGVRITHSDQIRLDFETRLEGIERTIVQSFLKPRLKNVFRIYSRENDGNQNNWVGVHTMHSMI